MSIDEFKLTLDRISNADSLSVDQRFYRAVLDYVDHTSTNGIDKFSYLRDVRDQLDGRALLDYGCGRAPHRYYLERLGYNWTGLDVVDPTDFRGEARSLPDVVYYDGGTIPLPDNAFDVVFSSQSFEHVHNPYDAMAEVARCLKPGGAFIGSVSFLEPYHAFQTFGYTPFGFMLIADRSGLAPVRLHPSADGLALIFRKLLIITHEASEDDAVGSSLTVETLLGSKAEALSPAALNALRLQFCGHFSFWFRLPGLDERR